MIGARTFAVSKRKKDKITETKKSVRSKMRLTARLYLKFMEIYNSQSIITLDDMKGDVSDVYRRETVSILTEAINNLTDKPTEPATSGNAASITDQKSGLKITIFNLIKFTSKFLIGYFLVKNQGNQSKKVVDFLSVLKMFEKDTFGDAYYELNYKKNTVLRKPQNLPKEDDVVTLNNECKKIMSSIDVFDLPTESFVNIRSAVVTFLIIFNVRWGGEPIRLRLYQWQEALDGIWVDKQGFPDEFDNIEMLITFQTGNVQITSFQFCFLWKPFQP